MYTIDIIIQLLDVIKVEKDINDYLELHQNSALYLLKQTVRQLQLSKNNYFLSEAAYKKWDQISQDDIWKYWYRNTVKCDKESEADVSLFKGGSKTPYDRRIIGLNDRFIFKDVFHDDHIIPIKLIINKLLEIESPNQENVRKVLKKISVCRMLKVEDRRIKEKSNRPFDEKQIIEKLYSKYGIYVNDYNYPYTAPEDVYEFNDEPIHLRIPKYLVKEYLPAIEDHGGEFVVLFNDMHTDVYINDENELMSITNDDELIHYVVMQMELNGG